MGGITSKKMNGGRDFRLKIGHLPVEYVEYISWVRRYHLKCPTPPLANSSKTPSLQWNNCLYTLRLYSQSFVAVFVHNPNLCQAVIWMFKCLSIDKEEITVLFPRWIGYFCPKWSGTKCPEEIYSQDEVKQPYLFVKFTEGVFTPHILRINFNSGFVFIYLDKARAKS